MIETMIVPLQKELQKEVTAFGKKMEGIWKKAKGEKIPKETQKELDVMFKKSEDQIKSKGVGHVGSKELTIKPPRLPRN